MVRFCIEKVAHRVPVIAGTGSNSTETAIYLSTEAEKYGADAVLLVTPYYNKATQNGLYQHFKQTADAIKIPVILYNVPSRTGCNILPETAVRLAKDVENIVAIKEASGNISQIAKLAHLANGCIDIYPGNDDAIRAVKLIVSKMADAVIEARQGEAVYTDEEVAAADAEAADIEQVAEQAE